MRYILYVAALLSFFGAFAQEEYVISLEGDTIAGRITIRRADFYDVLSIKTEDGRKEYRSYQLLSATKDIHRYVPLEYNNRRVIAKVIFEGSIGHYAIIPEDSNQFQDEILIKSDGSSLIISNIAFKKPLIKFIKECDILVNKIKEKEVAATNIEQVLAVYEEQCEPGNQQPTKQPNPRILELARLIIEVQSKLDEDERVPAHLIKELKEYSSSDLNSMFEKFTNQLEN